MGELGRASGSSAMQLEAVPRHPPRAASGLQGRGIAQPHNPVLKSGLSEALAACPVEGGRLWNWRAPTSRLSSTAHVRRRCLLPLVCYPQSLAAVIAGIVLMLDLLFDDSAFVFEPSFAAWQRKSGNA